MCGGGCLKSGYFFAIPDEFKIKSLYSNDLILNVAVKSKETVQKLKFFGQPLVISFADEVSRKTDRVFCRCL